MLRRIIQQKRGNRINWLNKQKETGHDSNDSDASLSSDDEEEVSKGTVGEWFNDQYFCIKYLGKGTFSRVWLVYNIEDREFYAMKIILPKYYKEGKHELKMTQLLKSSNKDTRLVQTKDVFIYSKNKNTICIIAELMGICMIDLFKKYDHNTIPESLIKMIFTDILKGLSEMHSKNIIHTDLKSENIMLNIFSNKIIKIKEWFSGLCINDIYENMINTELPENYSEMNPNKRKKIKRKCRIRARGKFSEYYLEKSKEYDEIISKLRLEKIEDIKEINDFDEVDEIELNDIDYTDDFTYDESIQLVTKIIDFGNAEHFDNRDQDEIQLRYYRPPENIINEYYDTKSDIWTLGCILFEVITGEYLFDIDKNKKSIEKDREHIHQMYEMFGKMPRKMTDECDFSEDLFDSKGRILKHKQCNYTNLKTELIEEYNIDSEKADILSNLLGNMFKYDPKERYSANDCLNHPWFRNNGNNGNNVRIYII